MGFDLQKSKIGDSSKFIFFFRVLTKWTYDLHSDLIPERPERLVYTVAYEKKKEFSLFGFGCDFLVNFLFEEASNFTLKYSDQ